jgi:hypothetical protein
MSPMRNAHDLAQELSMERNSGLLAQADQSFLHSHLSACQSCAAREQAISATLDELRVFSGRITASRTLVRTTQMRVRERAGEMQQHRERMSPLVIACTLACIWAIGSVPLMWHGFASMAQMWHLPSLLWQMAAVFFSLAPAALITAIGIAMRRERAEN